MLHIKKLKKKIQKKSNNNISFLESTLLELFIVRTLKNHKTFNEAKLIELIKEKKYNSDIFQEVSLKLIDQEYIKLNEKEGIKEYEYIE